MTEKKLPKELTNLVHQCLDILGQCIKDQYGSQLYKLTEKMRQQSKSLRYSGLEKRINGLNSIDRSLEKLTKPEDRFKLAHSFGLYLEVVNQCELAYRSFRNSKKKASEDGNSLSERITFVITAHPTESRSRECVEFLKRIRRLLIDYLFGKNKNFEEQLKYLLKLLLKIPLSKQTKPTVQDEADYLYSTLLENREVIDELIAANESKHQVYIRSWVGGDKDGHPGVDEDVMLDSLTTSRKYVLKIALDKILAFKEDSMRVIQDEGIRLKIDKYIESILLISERLKVVKEEDGRFINDFMQKVDGLLQTIEQGISYKLPQDHQLRIFFKIFPGLCIPLEMREDAEVVSEAVNSDGSQFAIYRMLKTLKTLSKDSDPRNYCRALILSMTESSQDILNGIKAVKSIFESYDLPVVPLLENKKALDSGEEILEGILSDEEIRNTHLKNFGGRYEVMLGYSDSSKESGSLASRVLIANSLVRLCKKIESYKMKPVFFHGSGGSISRGGGNLSDQISWWPDSAVKNYKATIQGEMVQRTFSTDFILRRKIDKIKSLKKKRKVSSKELLPSEDLMNFSEKVASFYRELVAQPKFLEFVETITPYSYLDRLRIGSRPSKRKKELNVNNLRAIPSILCWPQTRILLVVWWGIGSAWAPLDEKSKKRIKTLYKKEKVFQSYIKMCSFSLAKVDLSIVNYLLQKSEYSKNEQLEFSEQLSKEFKLAMKAVKEISGESNILWHTPWLKGSIELRTTAIYPLNVLQRIAIEQGDDLLLRETVTGIASGMLTTG